MLEVTHPVGVLDSIAHTGTLCALTKAGAPMVVIGDASRGAIEARSCVPLDAQDVGCEVVLLCTAGRPESPIVLGVLRPSAAANAVQVTADGKSVTVAAQESITLECGEARITLHRSGKVVIRGAHVVSHSTGVNRIRGGSVQLN